MTVAFEMELEREDRGRWHGLCCKWRLIGERRWRRFIVICSEGQTLLDLIGAALEAAHTDLVHAAAAA